MRLVILFQSNPSDNKSIEMTHPNKRNPNETYEDYKARMRKQKRELKAFRKGRIAYLSVTNALAKLKIMPGTKDQPNPFFGYPQAGRPYVRPVSKADEKAAKAAEKAAKAIPETNQFIEAYT